nr:MAG TPA: hypothetical protein [Bacteriophage sp.]
MSALTDLSRPTAMSLCLRVVFHAKVKRFDNLLKYDILVKLKEFFGFLERVRKRARKQKCIDFKAFLTSPLNSIGICK